MIVIKEEEFNKHMKVSTSSKSGAQSRKAKKDRINKRDVLNTDQVDMQDLVVSNGWNIPGEDVLWIEQQDESEI